jgi:hypothetical protein
MSDEPVLSFSLTDHLVGLSLARRYDGGKR